MAASEISARVRRGSAQVSLYTRSSSPYRGWPQPDHRRSGSPFLEAGGRYPRHQVTLEGTGAIATEDLRTHRKFDRAQSRFRGHTLLQSAAMTEQTALVRAAIKEMLPVSLPAIPFALALGIAIVESGLPGVLGWSTSPIIYGGASQLTLITLLGEGTAPAAAVTAALIINARHLMYSAAMAPTFQHQPAWFRWVGPYFLIDQVFALAIPRIHDDPGSFRLYYLTLGITFWVLWLAFTALGLYLGPAVPQSWGLGFAIPILFLGILVMAIDRWPKAVAALVAAGVALLAADLPHRLGLLLGAVAGIVAGVSLDRARRC